MLRIALAEILGTFIIVFLGTGSMILNILTSGAVTDLGVCLIWGFAVFLAIIVAERIGQGHFNPSVTLVVAIKQKLPPIQVSVRIVMQSLGAVGASLLLQTWAPGAKSLGETLPALRLWEVFLIEVAISFALMLTIEFSASKKLGLSAAATLIGAYVFVAAYITGPYTGCSMNPARSFGPAFIGGDLQWMWLYATAPTLGMLLTLPVLSKTRLLRQAATT